MVGFFSKPQQRLHQTPFIACGHNSFADLLALPKSLNTYIDNYRNNDKNVHSMKTTVP